MRRKGIGETYHNAPNALARASWVVSIGYAPTMVLRVPESECRREVRRSRRPRTGSLVEPSDDDNAKVLDPAWTPEPAPAGSLGCITRPGGW
jgi:hypothetical protein